MTLIANNLVKFMRKMVMELVMKQVVKVSHGLIIELRRRHQRHIRGIVNEKPFKEGTNDGVDK